MQNFMLYDPYFIVLWFLGRRRKHLKITKLQLCQSSPEILFGLNRPTKITGEVSKIHFLNFQLLSRHPATPNPKIRRVLEPGDQVGFVESETLKIDFFSICCYQNDCLPNLACTLPTDGLYLELRGVFYPDLPTSAVGVANLDYAWKSTVA